MGRSQYFLRYCLPRIVWVDSHGWFAARLGSCSSAILELQCRLARRCWVSAGGVDKFGMLRLLSASWCNCHWQHATQRSVDDLR